MATTESVNDLLVAHQAKDVLRFIACGSVDDGKSTLIGRLLLNSGALLEDQLEALADDSRRSGSGDGALDLSLALDGLAAEREQGITIDVAYRYFSTERRKFIVADTPGHEQYTRNMVTGASTADAAVILVDARHGVTPQTRRHTHLMGLLGIESVVLAVNKLDLLDFDRQSFDRIVAAYDELAGPLGFETRTAIPVSARDGDNVTARSERTPWYDGPTLSEWLHEVPPHHRAADGPFRMPVQRVNRPGSDFRGVSGQIVGGTARVGDRVRIEPSGVDTRVQRIVTFDGDQPSALTDESVTLVLADDVDASRGDIVSCGNEPASVADELDAEIVWMGDAPLRPGRQYTLRLGTRTATARLSAPSSALDVTTGERRSADTLETNGIATVCVSLDRPIAFDRYADNHDTGGCIVLDLATRETVAAGMITAGRLRANAIRWQDLDIDEDAHARLNGHRSRVLWMTGLSGAGKTTIADLVQQRLHAEGVRTAVLDGDNVRHGLCRDLGFSDAERVENNRRVAHVAKLMSDSGLVVIVSFISPFRAERAAARELFAPEGFVEVFVDAPLDVAEARDPKGLYKRARAGELRGFTGIDSPYEPPEDPDVHLDATARAVDAAERVVDHLRATGLWDVDGL